jgi:hypothetical protein
MDPAAPQRKGAEIASSQAASGLDRSRAFSNF